MEADGFWGTSGFPSCLVLLDARLVLRFCTAVGIKDLSLGDLDRDSGRLSAPPLGGDLSLEEDGEPSSPKELELRVPLLTTDFWVRFTEGLSIF